MTKADLEGTAVVIVAVDQPYFKYRLSSFKSIKSSSPKHLSGIVLPDDQIDALKSVKR